MTAEATPGTRKAIMTTRVSITKDRRAEPIGSPPTTSPSAFFRSAGVPAVASSSTGARGGVSPLAASIASRSTAEGSLKTGVSVDLVGPPQFTQ